MTNRTTSSGQGTHLFVAHPRSITPGSCRWELRDAFVALGQDQELQGATAAGGAW